MLKEKKSWKNTFKKLLFVLFFALVGFVGGYFVAPYISRMTPFDLILIVLVFAVSVPVHVVLHEGGHLIGGLLSGYQFIMFRLFNTVWIKADGKISKRRHVVKGILGQALMMPPEGIERPPFLLYHSGGFTINLITAILLIVLGQAISYPPIALACYTSASVALLLFIMNFIPMKPNDGYNILQLLKDPAALDEMTNVLHLYSGMVRGESFTDLQKYIATDELDSIENPNTVTLYSAQAAAHFERYEFEKARAIYEMLWNNREKLLEPHKPDVYFNYLYSLLVTNPQHEKIVTIQDTAVYKNQQKVNLADRLKVTAAEALYLDGDYERAAKILDEGKKLIALSPTPTEEKLERKMYAYLTDEVRRVEEESSACL